MDHSQEVLSTHESPSYHTKEKSDENKNIVIVKNLSNLVRDLNLFSKFQRYGDIKGVSVQVDKMTRVSKEIGFVQFSKAEQVSKCIQELNFQSYMGRELYLINKDHYVNVKHTQSTYFVYDLPKTLTNLEFRQFVESFGEIVISELYFIKNESKLDVDYGKVTFLRQEDGERFFQEGQNENLKIQDCLLKVHNFSVKENEKNSGFNLIIYNFPPTWNGEKIREFVKSKVDQEIFETCSVSQSKKKTYTVKIQAQNKSDFIQTIEKLNGEVIFDNDQEYHLVCTKFLNKKILAIQYKTEQVLQQSEKQQNLLIKYIKPDVTKETFDRIIRYFGEPSSAAIKISSIPYPGNPNQFFQMGFVSFENPLSTQKLLNEFKFNPDLLSIVCPSNQQCNFVKPLLNKFEKKMFMDVKENKNQKMDYVDEVATSQYASQDLDQSQMDKNDNDDFDNHVMDLLNSYNKYASPESFCEMLKIDQMEIINKMDPHSSQLLFNYILEDYLQSYFPQLEENQENFIQNMLQDYTGQEIIGIITKGKEEMLLNINVFLSSLGLEEISLEQQMILY